METTRFRNKIKIECPCSNFAKHVLKNNHNVHFDIITDWEILSIVMI
jgi:hypothetical protein